jgi:hypothetical protein
MGKCVWWSMPFVNDGGPLIVLPHEVLGAWGQAADDYAAAWDARWPVDCLPFGKAFSVVLRGLNGMVYEAKPRDSRFRAASRGAMRRTPCRRPFQLGA